jgi:hypothetical protein
MVTIVPAVAKTDSTIFYRPLEIFGMGVFTRLGRLQPFGRLNSQLVAGLLRKCDKFGAKTRKSLCKFQEY